jgi:hypothetical protein
MSRLETLVVVLAVIASHAVAAWLGFVAGVAL